MAALAITVGFAALTWLMVSLFVFRPLRRLWLDINRVAASRNLAGRVCDGAAGVAGEVAAGVNKLLAAIADAHRELSNGEGRYGLLAKNVADVIWTTDLQFNFTYVSPSVVRFNGFSADEVVGGKLTDFLTPVACDAARRALGEELVRAARREIGQDYVRTLELEHRHKDGHTFWAEVKASFIYNEAGEVVGVLGVSRDVTERKRVADELRRARDELEARVEERTAELLAANERLIAEIKERQHAAAALRESEEKYRGVVEHMQAGAVIIQDGVIKYVNNYLLERLSYAPGEIVGRKVGALFPARGGEGPLLPTNGFVVGGVHEAEVVSAGGDAVPVSYAASVVTFDGAAAVLAVLHDLSAEKEQERMLNEHRWISENVLSAMSEMVYVIDPDNLNVLFANETARRAAGGDVVGLKCFQVIWNLNDKCFTCCLESTAAREKESCTKEGFNERSGVWLRLNHKPITWLDGRTVICVVADDISESKALEEEIIAHNKALNKTVQERTAALEQKNRELESFAYSISHDLRAPLRSLEGFSRALVEDYGGVLDEGGRDYLNRIVNAAVRMDALINDLLAYSRLGRSGVHMESVNMEELLRLSLEDLRPAIVEAGAVVRVAGPLPTVVGDASMLHVLWTNLISNALKFRRPGVAPAVTVAARPEGNVVTFSVADNGIGIDPKFQDKVFNIFQRLHSDDEYPGTGIGLATAHKVVAAHGGRIWFESQPGQGATFFFQLPNRGEADDGEK